MISLDKIAQTIDETEGYLIFHQEPDLLAYQAIEDETVTFIDDRGEARETLTVPLLVWQSFLNNE